MPTPAVNAAEGIQLQSGLFPYQYLIQALSQTGGTGSTVDPLTGNTTSLDFTGLGTADVQNQTSAQMAQTLLNIQQTLGPQYVQLALQNLQQADPQGYEAYNQVWQQIQQQAGQPAPGIGMSEQVQSQIQNLLNNGQSLTPEELNQVEQSVRGNNVASGVYLGNAPAQAEVSSVIGATDQKQGAAQSAAEQFLASGASPADIQYQKLQQDMANYGAYISGQSPSTQVGQVSGARSGAAPMMNTGYNMSTLNEGQGGTMGINNASNLYDINANWSQHQVNPYLEGLNLMAGSAGAGLAAYGAYQSRPDPYANSGTMPLSAANPYWSNTTNPNGPYYNGP